MIWIILYIIVAAAAVFGLVFLSLVIEKYCNWYSVELWPAVICGIFWPIGAPIYGAYQLAMIYAEYMKNGGKK